MESFRNRLIKSWNHLEPFVLSFSKSLYNHLAAQTLWVSLDYEIILPTWEFSNFPIFRKFQNFSQIFFWILRFSRYFSLLFLKESFKKSNEKYLENLRIQKNIWEKFWNFRKIGKILADFFTFRITQFDFFLGTSHFATVLQIGAKCSQLNRSGII